MSGKRIGYIRVSTEEQNPDRQLEGVFLDKKFVEFASGKSTNRPQLKLLMDYVRDDDVVVIHSMDRLARNLRDLHNIVDHFIQQGASVEFMAERLTFDGGVNPMGQLLMSMMGAFAEFEFNIFKERQAEGIAVAKRKGVYKGRKKALDGAQLEALVEEYSTRKPLNAIARKFGISHTTLYRYLDQLNLRKPIELIAQGE
jgi:DNA invertase Pin-like site-specific DNA recombinase